MWKEFQEEFCIPSSQQNKIPNIKTDYLNLLVCAPLLFFDSFLCLGTTRCRIAAADKKVAVRCSFWRRKFRSDGICKLNFERLDWREKNIYTSDISITLGRGHSLLTTIETHNPAVLNTIDQTQKLLFVWLKFDDLIIPILLEQMFIFMPLCTF